MKKILVISLFAFVSNFAWGLSGTNQQLSQPEVVQTQCSPEPNTVGFTVEQKGPTILLGYSSESAENPIFSFMYFVPVISPTLVEMEISEDCLQKGRLISHKIEQDSDSFVVEAEMEIKGSGYYKNSFDADSTYKWILQKKDDPDELTKVLDYIKFEGEGFGKITVAGKISNGVKDVTELTISFNARDCQSPVTIGLYDVEKVNGEFSYENACNNIYARINSLKFKKADGEARMAIDVSSISSSEDSSGFWAKVKGKVANMFVKSIRINPEGNESILDFGLAIAKKETTYTFPIAKNLKQNNHSLEQLALKESDFKEIKTP